MTSFVDEFARPDAGTLGTGWLESTAGFHIVSGAAVPDTTNTNVAQRTLDLATGDHSVTVEIGNTYGGLFNGCAVRMPTLGADGASTGAYYLLILSGSTGTAFSIRRKEANATTLTTLKTGTAPTDGRVDGSVWRLEVSTSGSTNVLNGYLNDVLVVTATDTATAVPATQRRVGIYGGGTGADSLRYARVTGSDIAPVSADVAPPSVPANVTATAQNSTTVLVSWSASTDATGVVSYRVRRDGTDLAAEVVGTSYTDTAALTGSHSYTVSAVDPAGNRSAESAAASVTIAVADTTPPPVPSGVTATAGVNQVALSWTAVSASDLANYRVYRWTGTGTHTLIGSPTGTSFTDTGAAAGTTYSYAVRAVDRTGNASAESSTVTATPTAPTGGGATFTVWTGTTEATETVGGIWNGSSTTPVTAVTTAS